MANSHENNPFIPNSKAWWCPKCKAHHDYDYSESYGSSSSGVGRTTYGKYSCKVCRATMLCPAKTLPWMYGLTGGGIILLAMGLWMGVSKGGFDFENGIELFYLLFAIFPLLIGGMMIHYMKKWFAWSSAQKKKTPEELELEVKNPPPSRGEDSEK